LINFIFNNESPCMKDSNLIIDDCRRLFTFLITKFIIVCKRTSRTAKTRDIPRHTPGNLGQTVLN